MIVDLLRNDLGARLRDRQRARCRSCSDVETYRDRPPARLDGPRAVARADVSTRRPAPRRVPARLDDRRAEAAHDGDHRPARGPPARRLLGRDRLPRARRRRRPQRRHPHARGRPSAAVDFGDGRRDRRASVPEEEHDETLLKARALLEAVASAAPPQPSIEAILASGYLTPPDELRRARSQPWRGEDDARRPRRLAPAPPPGSRARRVRAPCSWSTASRSASTPTSRAWRAA